MRRGTSPHPRIRNPHPRIRKHWHSLSLTHTSTGAHTSGTISTMFLLKVHVITKVVVTVVSVCECKCENVMMATNPVVLR